MRLDLRKLFKKNQTEDESLRLIFDERKHLEIELSRCVEDIQKRLQELDLRLLVARENGAKKKQLAAIKREEDDLWLVLRRLQASLRSTADLERQYVEWGSLVQKGSEKAVSRMEIVASELKIRGVDVDSLLPAPTCEGSAQDACRGDASRRPQDNANLDETDLTSIVWEQGSADNILDEIERAKSDLRRVEHAEEIDPRAAFEMLKSLRHHHAALRLMDRSEGRRRVRIGL